MSLLDMRPRGAGGGSGAPADATYITQTPNVTLTNEQALSLLATGLLKNTTGTGVLSIGAAGTDYLAPAAIGVTVQAWDADLDTLAGLAKADGNFIVGDGAAWVVESGATARTSLGLGTIAIQNANNVTISGGSVTGITDLAIADGGTGQSTAQAAIDALTNVAAATNEHVLTKDTATGNAIFKALSASSILPVVDTQTIVKGSADATKLLRFEIDGFTAGATRVLTPPNANATIAGLEIANIFTANQQLDGVRLNLKELTFNNVMYFEPTAAGGIFAKMQGNGGFIVDTNSANGFFQVQQASGTPFFKVAGNVALTLSTIPTSTSAAANALILQNLAVGNNSGPRIKYTAYNANTNLRDMGAIDTTWVSNTQGSEETRLVIGLAQGISASATSIKEVLNISSSTGIFALSRNLRTGSPGVGFSVAALFQLQSTTTERREAGRMSFEWVDDTDASRKARSKWTVYDTAEREAIRIEASGSAPMLGFLGATAIARPASYTLASTATRTMPTPESAFTGQDNAQAGSVYAKSADLITLQTRLDSVEGVLRQLIIDLASTSGYGLLVAS